MRANTASKIAQSIQLLKLDGYDEYTLNQLSDASGINRKTLSRNHDIIDMLDFAMNIQGYDQCLFPV